MKTEILSKKGLEIYHEEMKNYIQKETELNSEDVINALGYTPATEQTVPVFSFEVIDGDLIMYYSDGSSAPLAYINADGYLIMDL